MHYHVLCYIWAVLLLLFFFGGTANQDQDGLFSKRYLMDVYFSGVRRLTKNAVTSSCKSKIEFEFMKHIRALAEEGAFPFEDILFTSMCPASDGIKLVRPSLCCLPYCFG